MFHAIVVIVAAAIEGILYALAHPSIEVTCWDKDTWDDTKGDFGSEVKKTISSCFFYHDELPPLEHNVETEAWQTLPVAPYIELQTCYNHERYRYNNSPARGYTILLFFVLLVSVTLDKSGDPMIYGFVIASFTIAAFVFCKIRKPYHVTLVSKAAREAELGSAEYCVALNHSAILAVGNAVREMRKVMEHETYGMVGMAVTSASVLVLEILGSMW